jgi:hypothetical protein
MKRPLVLVFLSLFGWACAKGSTPITTTPNKPNNDWFAISASYPSLVEVTVERALFERSDQAHFFLHFWVRNLRNKPVSIDLRNKQLLLHPNQWGFSPTNYRQSIDEGRMTKPSPEDQVRQELLMAFEGDQLQPIEPSGAFDFFVEFNASGRRDIEAQAASWPFLIVSMDGELLATNGRHIEWHSLLEDFDTTKTDLVLTTPLLWKTIPEGAQLILR